MTEILILRGFPASGKTTYAMGLAETHTRVSRDDIRRNLTGRADKFVGDFKFEEQVSEVQENLVRTYLAAGRSVVLDDTNLRLKYTRKWVHLANRLGVEVDLVNFKVPLEELLERNRRRVAKVPDEVIEKMYKNFPYKQWPEVIAPVTSKHVQEQYVPDPNKPPLVTVDLDGTLAEHTSGRNPYDTTRYHEDTLNEGLAAVLAFLKPHVKIGVFTGRQEKHREVCEQWLGDMGVEYDFMLMRPDDRPNDKDADVKVDLFKEHIAHKYNHLIHFDDRYRVVQALRSIGVQVAQVAEGNF